MADLAQDAHDYAAHGWAVFPLQPGEKKPYGFTTGLHAASGDVDVVSAWWAGRGGLPIRPPRQPGERLPARPIVPRRNSNIGLRTGAMSRCWVFDIDGEEGVTSLLALTERHGRLPQTVRQITGGGGGQLFFQWPGRLPWGVEIRNSASKADLGAHLDVRGEGGYVVLPPSLHPSGRRYEWVEGCAPWECELARAPWWLLRMVAPPPAPVPTATHEPRRQGERVAGAGAYANAALDLACAEIRAAKPGTRNQTLHRNCYGVGRLVAGGELPRETARDALIRAGLDMGAGDGEFGLHAVSFHVDNAFQRATAAPKKAPEGDRR